MSRVTTVPAASPEVSAAHFAARLAVETDAADVGAAVADGTLDAVVIDVRSADAYATGHIRGAMHLPHEDIDAERVAALPPGLLVVYCWGPGCNGAHKAAARLATHGRTVKEMIGGWEYYSREGWPAASSSPASS